MGYPFRRLLGIAGGLLKWSPAQFWSSTPHELFAAIDVWRESNGDMEHASKSEWQEWAQQLGR